MTEFSLLQASLCFVGGLVLLWMAGVFDLDRSFIMA